MLYTSGFLVAYNGLYYCAWPTCSQSDSPGGNIGGELMMSKVALLWHCGCSRQIGLALYGLFPFCEASALNMML